MGKLESCGYHAGGEEILRYINSFPPNTSVCQTSRGKDTVLCWVRQKLAISKPTVTALEF